MQDSTGQTGFCEDHPGMAVGLAAWTRPLVDVAEGHGRRASLPEAKMRPGRTQRGRTVGCGRNVRGSRYFRDVQATRMIAALHARPVPPTGIATCMVRHMGNGPMTGEAVHEAGRDGVRRAKDWLEATSRVDACWVNPDNGARQKLTFPWPQGGLPFSFDLGGKLRYGPFDGQLFYAEVKKYTVVSNLGTHFKSFLAKCYVAYQAVPSYTDHFMWISWTPHGVTKWAELASQAEVKAAVRAHASRIFPADTDLDTAVDDEMCAKVSERIWILILSDKQEALVPSTQHLSLIHAHEMNRPATP